MTIGDYNENQFLKKLNDVISPSDPIRSPENLKGREQDLKDISRNLNMRGRHIFIYGDRGVGKTSLAQSAAIQFHPSSSKLLRIGCGSDDNFYSVVSALAKRTYLALEETSNKIQDFKIDLKLVSFSIKDSLRKHEAPQIETLNDAVDVLNSIAQCYTSTPVIIIDEFDRIQTHRDQELFSELIKQIVDQEINLKLIFCGIGSSMEDLLGAHLSSSRSVFPIKLERLDNNSSLEIIHNSSKALSIKVDYETERRISQLSDGFPYFVHLVCEYMYTSAFDDENKVNKVLHKHFDEGVTGAIQHAMPILKVTYDTATQKYRGGYQEVLWALADKPTLTRQSNDIYENSYLPIMKLKKATPMTKPNFDNKLNKLKTKAHDRILISRKRSWFEYRENMIRGYVRLKAREDGIDLGADHHHAEQKTKGIEKQEPRIIQL